MALSSEVSRKPLARNAEQEHLLFDRSVEAIKGDIKIIEGQKIGLEKISPWWM